MTAERQVRTLMRAWPRPDRIERGDEIAATTLDLLPDGATRIPVLLALNLLVGGVRARWRLRPPPWRWLHYRMGGRLPAQWHRWMLNDLTAPGWRRRIVTSRAVGVAVGACAGIAVVQFVQHQSGGLVVLPGALIGGLIGTLARSRKERDRQLVRNGYCWPAANEPPWPPPPAPATFHQTPGAPDRLHR